MKVTGPKTSSKKIIQHALLYPAQAKIKALLSRILKGGLGQGGRKYSLSPSAIHAHEHVTGVKVVHESWLLCHQYYVVGKVLDLKKRNKIPHVIDVGCGKAPLLSNLRLNEDRNNGLIPYVGIDIRNAWGPLLEDSAFVTCNVSEYWPLKSNSVECIVLSEMLEHVGQTAGASLLRNICGSLKPGGYLILTTFIQYPNVDPSEEKAKYGHVYYWPIDSDDDNWHWPNVPDPGVQPRGLLDFLEDQGGKVIETWVSRYQKGNRKAWDAVLKKAESMRGGAQGGHNIVVSIRKRYGDKILRSLVAHAIDWKEACQRKLGPSHIELVFQKRPRRTIPDRRRMSERLESRRKR